MIDKNKILYNFFNDNLNHIFNDSTDTYKYHNNIKLYKRGSKIQIKKSNRGKFTEYCGGKVTEECINKAKNSENKKLIKRAVFAQNARRWNKNK